MTIKIEKDFEFQAAVHFENTFMMNVYDIKLNMSVLTDDQREQNVAIERINYYLLTQVEHGIFVDKKLKSAIKKYEAAGLNVIPMPEEPYDQIVGLILMLKLDAIMEDRLIIDNIVFGSKLTSGIKFQSTMEEAAALFSGDHWWNNNLYSFKTYTKKDKVVKLVDISEWQDVGLTWQATL